MTTVYIWERSPRSKCGHASMQCGSTYISWWPGVSLLGPADLPRALKNTGLFPARGLEDDVRAEGRVPDQTFLLPKLSESRILYWWQNATLGLTCQQGWDTEVCDRARFGWNSVRIVDTAVRNGMPRDGWSTWEIVLSVPMREAVWTAHGLRCRLEAFLPVSGLRSFFFGPSNDA